uniref:Uncharacterized protein n=1 Tax=Anguilla anguilla TaxID=7936 RepID=A0A0E9SXQ6_ANGAN
MHSFPMNTLYKRFWNKFSFFKMTVTFLLKSSMTLSFCFFFRSGFGKKYLR